MTRGSVLLGTQGLRKSFGAIVAIDSLDMEIVEGEFRSVIGPNGAGKTTLFNLLTGQLRADSGRISFAGRVVTGLPPHAVCALGVARTFQKTSLFWGLSVLENVRLAVQAREVKGYPLLTSKRSYAGVLAETERLLELTGLAPFANQPARALSHGDQRLLEIAVGLGCCPRLLLLDEPTAGMSPAETKRAVELIRELSKSVTVVLIEHDMDVVLHVSDRITVLHFGRVIADGSPEQIQRDQEVQRAYLGLEE